MKYVFQSQSPEGSACHFKGSYHYGNFHPRGVAITRRLCVSFQAKSYWRIMTCWCMSQSPEGSACHFKHSKYFHRDSRFSSQSPEGSACHFKSFDSRHPHCGGACVAITRRLCVSFQAIPKKASAPVNGRSRNHPKALRVISRKKLSMPISLQESRNHPKALRVISRVPMRTGSLQGPVRPKTLTSHFENNSWGKFSRANSLQSAKKPFLSNI